jgi:hypothetical protein
MGKINIRALELEKNRSEAILNMSELEDAE